MGLEIDNDLKNGLKSCYLLYGEDSVRRKIYEDRIKKKLVDEASELMNVSVFNDAKTTAGQIIEAAETFPFLSDRRVVIVRECSFFTENKKTESDILAEYMASVPDYVCIVFSEIKADKRFKLYKAISKKGLCEEIKPFDEKDIVDIVGRKLTKNKLKISKALCVQMVRNAGANFELLSSDTDKLIAYMGDRQEVTAEDINAVCTKTLEVKVFDMINAMIDGRTEKALEIYRNLLIYNEPVQRVFALIRRQFEIILNSKSMSESGLPNADIAKRLGVMPFAVTSALRQANKFSYPMLVKALNSCIEVDYNARSGGTKLEIEIERLIITRAGTM